MGCHVGHMSYEAFGYADDLLLLSPSIRGLDILVKTYESFASEYGVTSNAKKTQSASVLVKHTCVQYSVG